MKWVAVTDRQGDIWHINVDMLDVMREDSKGATDYNAIYFYDNVVYLEDDQLDLLKRAMYV
jgi:hypothetical protein